MAVPREKDVATILESLRGYLQYWRSCGIDELPVSILPDLSGTKKVASRREEIHEGRNAGPSGGHLVSEIRKNESPGRRDRFPVTGQSGVLETLDQIREEIGDCTRCRLHEKRKNIVFGSGDPRADLVFVGEAPGEQEDRLGEPFVGRAGSKLTEIIEKGIGVWQNGVFVCDNLKRKDVYICNVVKCRPPDNRDPRDDEISTCLPFLIKQIRFIRPRVIVALGRIAASALLGRKVDISRERGNWHRFEGTRLMLTYHPSYLLRSGTNQVRADVWRDMISVAEELKNA